MKRKKAFKATLRLLVAFVFALQVIVGSLILPGGFGMQTVYGAGETNVVKNKPATASGSTAPYAPARAADGQITPTSRWQCSTAVKYLTIDLKGVYKMNRWVVKNLGAAGWTKDNNTQSYRLQRSIDGSKFVDVDKVTKNTANITDRRVASFTARYVRLYIDAGSKANPAIANILELEVYGTAVNLPTVTTASASSISYDKAAVSGNISSDGGDSIVERGIVYSQKANPTTADSKVISKGTTGSFSAALTGLLPGTVYHGRAYAKNSAGTAYGQDISFTTPARNHTPIVTNGYVNCTWGSSYSFSSSDFTKYYYDYERSPLDAIKITALPKGGTLLLNSTPINVNQQIPASNISYISFVPTQNFCGPCTFKWTASDKANYADVDALYTINVAVTGTAPKLIDITKNSFEDTILKLSLKDFSAGFFGPGGSSLDRLTFLTVPANGTLKVGNDIIKQGYNISAAMLDAVTFTPAYNWSGTTSFSWTAATSTNWADTNAGFTINIASVNDKPISTDGFKEGVEDTPLTFMGSDFMSRYNDLEGSSLAGIKITACPTKGTLMLGSSKVNADTEIPVNMLSALIYIPDKDFFGSAYFYFKVSDGSDFSDTEAKFEISVIGINDAPVVTEGQKTGIANTSLAFTAEDFTRCYSDGENTALSCIKILSLPAHGTLKIGKETINVNSFINAADLGKLVFVPDVEWTGTTNFVWRAYDGTDLVSSDATFTINIASVN